MAPGMSSMLLSFPVLMMAQKIDWEVPDNVMYARLAFAVVQLAAFLLGNYLKSAVAAKKDMRTCYVAPPSMGSLFGGGAGGAPKKVKKTTYFALESEKAGQMAQQTLVNAALMAFMSFQFNIQLPLVMQVVMTPMNLLTDGLVSRYVRNVEKEGAYSETLEVPEGAEVEVPVDGSEDTASGSAVLGIKLDPATAATANSGSNSPKKTPRNKQAVVESTPTTRATESIRKMVDQVWPVAGAKQLTDVNTVAALVELGGDINASVAPEAWTLLMVTCGNTANPAATIRKLLQLGADRFAVDSDGWTPLHWAADNNNIDAVKVLMEALPASSQLELMGAEGKNGDAALEVAAEKQKSPAVAVYLADLFKSLTSDSGAVETKAAEDEVDDITAAAPQGMRQRKAFDVKNAVDID